MKFTIMPLLTLALLLPVTPLTAVEIAATPRANSLPVTAASRPQLAAPAAELAARAYSEEEFLVSGTASLYQWGDTAQQPAVATAQRQRWSLRLLVRRPQRAALASGRVIVELLDASGGSDSAPVWALSGAHFMRQGDVWVGLTVQRAGLAALRRDYAKRYAGLSALPAAACAAPGTPSASWDAIAQVGALLRSSSRENPLAAYPVRQLLAAGRGAAAADLVTYLHSAHVQQRLGNDEPVFDAYLLASLTTAAAPVSDCAPALAATDPRQQVPAADAPVVLVMTEADVAAVPAVRLSDGDVAGAARRLYEIAAAPAGAPPATGALALAGDSGAPCVDAANTFPTALAVNGIWQQLHQLLHEGQALAQAAPLQRDASGKLQRDPRGNALGGVRLPPLSVPLLAYGTGGQARDGSAVAGRRCALAGAQRRFDSTELKTLYGNRAAWLKTYQAALAQAVAERWLLEPDAAVLKAQAATAPVF